MASTSNTVAIVISAIDRTKGFGDLQRNLGSLQKQTQSASVAASYLAGVAGTSLVAGLVGAATASIKNAEAMGENAQKAGMAVEEFSQMSFAAKQASVSQETLIKASKALSEQLVKAGRGSESVLAQMLAQADVFAKMKDGAEKTTLAVQLFGKSGQDLIPLLNQGSEAIRKQMDQADKLGLTISADFARQADEFGDNVEAMKSGLMGMGNTLAQTVLPALTRLQQYFVDTEYNLKKAHTAADDLTLALVFMSEVQKQFNAKQFFGALSGGIVSTVAELARLREAWKATVEGFAGEQESDSKIDIDKADPMLPGGNIAEHSEKYKAFIQQMTEAAERFRNMQLEGFEREKAQLESWREAQVTTLDGLATSYQQFVDGKLAVDEAYYARLNEISGRETKKDQDDKARHHDVIVQQASLAFGRMASASKAFGKKGLDAWKAFSTAQAIIDTYGAANAAYKALAGIPVVGPALGAAAAAAAIAAGMANVHAIQSTQAQAHAGLDFVPSEQTFLLQRGERVVQPEQNVRLTKMLDDWESGGGRGGMQQLPPITVNVDGEALFRLIFDGTRDGRIQVHPRGVSSTRN